MRRSESRDYKSLSSSATNIRSSNYSVPRTYTPSLSTYRYSASSYTPTVRGAVSNGTSEPSSYSSATLGRSSGGSSSLTSGSALTRSSSSSYARSLYQSPANARSSFTPSSYASSAVSPQQPPQQQQAAPPATTRSRSSSAISSYRSINVAALNQAARERADRDEKDRHYSDWLERERFRSEVDAPLAAPEPLIKDFRKKTGSTTSLSPGYSSFSRSVVARSEVPLPSEPPKYTPHATSYKPSATVYDDRDTAPAVQKGFTGLRNIGNTCFMNATLQMLVNNVELKTYFIDRHYKIDVNPSNPLGFRGRLADAFADFMRQMWNCQHRAVEPVKIKELVAEKASQFANFAQHDAHEFLSFLLDGLHEDLNRVKTKPITDTVEGDGRPDIDISSEAWRNHTLRNDSIFVDLFHGQLKSRLQCPKCDRVSITFDPFVYLAVPFPKIKKTTTVVFWPLDVHQKPVKIPVHYSPDGTVQDMLTALSDLVRVQSKSLRLVEVFSHRIQKVFQPQDKTTDICSGDLLYVFQLQDPTECNEPVVEIYVIQRQLYASTLRYSCNHCGRHDTRLKACEACYNAYYCNKDCQLTHWNEGSHRDECRRRAQAEPVGQPLIVSLPASKLTYSHLMKLLEQRTKYSVDIVQAQTMNGGDDSEPPTRSGSECSTKGESKYQRGAAPGFHLFEPISGNKSPSPSRAGSTPRRQSGLSERKKADHRLFLLRKLSDQASILGDTIVSGKSGEPLNISSGSYISLNWYNVRYGKPFISVATRKNLDIDDERSEQPTRLSGKSTSSGGDPSLMEMMGMFSETERLKPEESWYCNQCREHVEATKKLELYRIPPVLIVQLKRFVYTATYTQMHRRSKDERRVVYPLTGLDMAPYLAESAPKQNTMYDLTGVVCHSGSSFFGHYVSMGRLADFDSTATQVDWRSFDDSIVAKQAATAAQSDDAYLLFYKQRGKTTRPIFRKHYSCDPTATPEPEEPYLNGINGHKDLENGNVSY